MLHQVAAPIGVAEGDHNWDFGFRYLWADFELSDEAHLTAEREVSYRHWSAGAQVQGFKVRIPFSMPHRGDFAAEIGVGRDGDHVIGSEGDPQMEWVPDPQPDTKSSWGGKGAKLKSSIRSLVVPGHVVSNMLLCLFQTEIKHQQYAVMLATTAAPA